MGWNLIRRRWRSCGRTPDPVVPKRRLGMRPAKRRFASDSIAGSEFALEIEIRQAPLGNDRMTGGNFFCNDGGF